MMNVRVVGLLLIAAMLLALFMQRLGDDSGEIPPLLLPGLKGQLALVQKVSIRPLAEEQVAVSIQHEDAGWRLSEKSDYPADFEALSAFLSLLSEVKIAEKKTARKKNHGRLGLADSGEQAGTLVSVESATGVTQLVIGESSESRGSFVRLVGDPQVYLTDAVITASPDPMDWLDSVATSVDSSKIRKVTMVKGDVALLSAERNEAGELILQNLPEAAELKYATVADDLARMLVNLRFLDVEPLEPGRFDQATMTTFTLDDGETVVAKTVRVADDYWLHLDTESNRGWQYKIREYTFNEFNKALEDMLKNKGQNE